MTGRSWFLLLALLTGCVEPTPLPEGPIGHGQVEDLPVPSGFIFIADPERSYVLESGSFRQGRWEYHGEFPSIEEGLAFFRERLPDHGWVEVPSATSPGQGQLRFAKVNQTLDLQIGPIGPGESRGYPHKTVFTVHTTGKTLGR